MASEQTTFRFSPLDNPLQRSAVRGALIPAIHKSAHRRTQAEQQEVVERLRRRLVELDEQMTRIIGSCGTRGDLVMWAATLDGYLRDGLGPLDENISQWGTPACNMAEIVVGEACLEAAIKSTEMTIAQYE